MTLRLLGVSIPRSGHHYLARLLQSALGARLRYCRFYDAADCCGRLPCRRDGSEILFQKNHDFDLALPLDLPVRYLVQVRDPVAGALSDRALYAQTYGRHLAADPVDLVVWLAKKALWLEGFAAKWLTAPPPTAVLLRYEDLTGNPASALTALLAALEIEAAPAALETAVAAEATRGGFTGERDYVPARVESSSYFDPQLFAHFETLLSERAPGLARRRLLPAVLDAGHPFAQCHTALRQVAAGDLRGAAAGFAQARRELGDEPALLLESALVAKAQGDLPLAADLLVRADAGRPDDPALLMQRILLARALRDLPLAAALARQVIRLLPHDPGHRVLLALILADAGDRAASLVAVADAEAARPREATHWHSLGGVLLRFGETDRARGLLAEATRRWPDDRHLAALHAQVAG